MRYLPLIVAGGALVLLAIALALPKRGPRDMTGQAMPVVTASPLPLDAVSAPQLTTEFDTAALAGSPYILNVFASWCAPCIVEHPVLMELAEQGVTIHGLAWLDEPDNARNFIETRGNPYVSIGVDTPGRIGRELGVEGAPESFIVSAGGDIVRHWRGPITLQVWRETLEPAWIAAQADGDESPDPAR